MKKLLSILLSICVIAGAFVGCSHGSADTSATKKDGILPAETRDLRVVAYVTAGSIEDMDSFDTGHMAEVTDVILFGVASFDQKGNIVLADNFDQCYDNIRKAIGDNKIKLHVNILGPGCSDSSLEWEEQMADQAKRHTDAFCSGVLQGNIKQLLEDNGFDGVFFDYEFPMKRAPWRQFNNFLVSLDEELDDAYAIGVTAVGWDLKLSDAAIEAVDYIELMSYDLWDDDGNHATMDIAKDDIAKCKRAGYDLSKVDLGLPFYARPTTKDAYWYEYKSYSDQLDANGLYDDKETGLTFSFNTADVVRAKTSYAYDEGLAGVMMWHYSCDTAYGAEDSLFGAVDQVRQTIAMAE